MLSGSGRQLARLCVRAAASSCGGSTSSRLAVQAEPSFAALAQSYAPAATGMFQKPLFARGFATEGPKAPDASTSGSAAAAEQPEAADAAKEEGAAADAGDASTAPPTRSVEELEALVSEKNETISGLTKQVEDLTDKVKRSLADMENLRYRTARDLESTQKFAVQGFVKSLLDVADNLQRAAESVPAEALEGQEIEKERAVALLKSLLEGVQMTERVLLQVFKQNAVQAFDPVGEKFNPNDHNALFEVPDPSKEAGTVAVVTKRGYKMHERVVRPADVGVVRAP